jgi:hypothetical protein
MEAEGRAAMEELCANARPATGQNCSRSEKFTLGIVLVPTHSIPSLYFRGHPLDLRHVVVLNRSRVTIIPRYGDITPCRSDDRAEIGGAILPANAVVDLKKSGLIAGHFSYLNPSAP